MAPRKANKTTPKVSMRENQARKLQMQKIAKGGRQLSGVSKPKPAPVAKPSGAQPRAITNGSSPTMRQLRAKAVQANRQAQGKPVQGGAKGRATTLPNSARAGRNLIREGAQRMRTIGDSGQTRAAAEQGRKVVETAQRNRARRAAGVGRGAAELRGAARVGRLAGPAAVAYETLKARPTAKGTISPGGAQGPSMPKRLKEQGYAAQEKRAREKNATRKNTSFDDAFRDARRAKVSTFTWRGKKYNTKIKGE
jgi:hypothetical protein